MIPRLLKVCHTLSGASAVPSTMAKLPPRDKDFLPKLLVLRRLKLRPDSGLAFSRRLIRLQSRSAVKQLRRRIFSGPLQRKSLFQEALREP